MSAPPVGNPIIYSDYNAKYPYDDFLVLNNATFTATSTSQGYYIGAAKTLEVLNVITTGPASGTGNVLFKVNIVEPSSNTIVATYPGSVISASGSTVIIVNNTISALGDTVSITWTVTSASGPPSWSGVYSRLIAKP